jgi:tetratricopeptide (TPR) repeat protein
VAQAAHVLDAGLARFPSSWDLHDRLRGRVFEDRGLEGLEPAYEERLAGLGATPELRWYAGYASLVAAEFDRRAGDSEAAQASYGRAIEHFERAAGDAPGMRDSADHYIALALAGRARMALEQGDLATALDQLLASLERHSEAAASLDGLGLTPVMTAQMLLARLKERGDAERADRLQEALDALDPELLKPPAFENLGPARGRTGRRPGARGSGR